MPTNTKKKTQTFKQHGWNTSDEDEIARRIARAQKELFSIEQGGTGDSVFGDWIVMGESNQPYRVEMRSLGQRVNSCGCADFQVNGLGTCKHIEAVLHKLGKQKPKVPPQGTMVDIYLNACSKQVEVLFPQGMKPTRRIRQVVSSFFDEKHRLRGDPVQSMQALQQQLAHETPQVQHQLRMSAYLEEWLQHLRLVAERRQKRRYFEQDLRQGRESLDVVKKPLYPYQQEGMMHLAFTGRALLADEMGLGKTVQAIAASELLNRLDPLQKVLVISSASLKSEWLEQIGTFSHRQALVIEGGRKKRHKLYQQPAFFFLANYEQILYDHDFINGEFKPDLIILDEAQRIKNWQSKTANAVKRLQSPYAFVLTGTPLENRIDEIYSIVQFLDPAIFGSLFRFNRDYHLLDEKGQAVGYKNLDQLHERLRPIMLRRRKQDVEGELPQRSVNNYFVSMTEEQQSLYAESEQTVSRLGAQAKKRPLTKKERDILMLSLGCMRMACDSAFVLDQKTRSAPKLDELERLLEELLLEPDCKIILFSEWERMLRLLEERLTRTKIGYAWHTGSITQKKRREEINRFKNDADCRLFLATDSASTGLNLQIARVVINLDLPWNPAKLEQRIARAWRKHQKHPVAVINLVTEHSIEHRMLDVLRHKTDLAEAVIDGQIKTTDMKISAKSQGSFMQQLDELLGESSAPAAKPASALERLNTDLQNKHPDNLTVLEQHGDTLLAIVDEPDKTFDENINQRISQHFPDDTPHLETIDRTTYETLQRLAAAGVIQFTQHQAGGQNQTDEDKKAQMQRRQQARIEKYLKAAEEKQRMGRLLADGGFVTEALQPMCIALNQALAAADVKSAETTENTGAQSNDPLPISRIGQLQSALQLPADTVSTVATLRHETDSLDQSAAKQTITTAETILMALQKALE
jgi:hypothetical protein